MSERRRPGAEHVLRRAATAEEPQGMHVLLAAGAIAPLPAGRVAAAIARGLRQGGLAAPESFELPDEHDPAQLRRLLAQEDFDARLHLARALVLATGEASERSLAGSALFELATRARQAGVPAYAIAGRCSLAAFDARVLDLQLVLEASDARSLALAGRRLAGAMCAGAATASAGNPGTRT
jgi:hypothetical protein